MTSPAALKYDNKLRRHRFLAPEVVQSSAMDCGPASLKCLFEGFGINVSYGRLREACQTDVDGTSIDTLEEVAKQLGLEADQLVVPADHLWLAEAALLPALVVVRQGNGNTHFIVVWRRIGNWVQVVDPAQGRIWKKLSQFKDDLHLHTMPVGAGEWREWAGSNEFLKPLRRRIAILKIPPFQQQKLIASALNDKSWHRLAALDAAVRMVEKLAAAGAIRRGVEAEQVLNQLLKRAYAEPEDCASQVIPPDYWSVWPISASDEHVRPIDITANEPQLLMRGAVLIQVRGRRLPATEISENELGEINGEREIEPDVKLSPELVTALAEPATRPVRELLKLLKVDGLLAPGALGLALGLAAAGTVIEALLFLGLLNLSSSLAGLGQAGSAILALLSYLAVLLFLHLITTLGIFRLGRLVENRLRRVFLRKILELPDRYFQSRLVSDMAERAHSLYLIRRLPQLAARMLSLVAELLLTILGLIWLDPASAPLAVLLGIWSFCLPFVPQPFLVGSELKLRTHNGALGRFYLDGLLGLVAIRTHRAERVVRRQHEKLLGEWTQVNHRFQLIKALIDGSQFVITFSLIGWLIFDHFSHATSITGTTILYVYWAVTIFSVSLALYPLTRQYPTYRNVALRLFEPLTTPTVTNETGSTDAEFSSPLNQLQSRGVRLAMRNLSVRAAGQTILENINLAIEAGEHVAIVGPSGAGKSSLVGLLLGWHQPAAGQLLVNDKPLDSQGLSQLRRQTAWVDPAVQLWNRSLLENLQYGLDNRPGIPFGEALEQADLQSILDKLPQGLQTELGEGGKLLSGGEGQRVRLGRAMLRPDPALVILDEPFRGLDRQQRHRLLARSRLLWQHAALLCVTHDVGETQLFDRVLVVEGGQIVEDGRPGELMQQTGSRYRQLLETESLVHRQMWGNNSWRRYYLANGQLTPRDSLTPAGSRFNESENKIRLDQYPLPFEEPTQCRHLLPLI